MEVFLQQLVNGVSLGSIYALVALGYTMVYGIIKLINFAHCDIYMIGAYIGYFCMTYFGLSFFPSLLVAMTGCMVLGVLIEKIAYKPLRNAARISLLITAIGMSLFLEYGTMFLVSAKVRTYPAMTGFMAKTFHIGNVLITMQQIVILATTIALMLALQYIVKYTRAGKAMRAVSEDRDAAELMGISVNRTITITFAIGSALAAVAGVFYGTTYGFIGPYTGSMPGIKAFVAAVFGGIGSIPGAMLGGILLGVIENLAKRYISTELSDAIVFAVLIIVLMVKPTGLLGKRVNEKV